MKRSVFLEAPNALWLKGNLHSHTVFSDGSWTPEEMKAEYKRHGYDFLAVTDHDTYTDTRALTDDSFTMLQGFELWGNATNDKDIHIHFLWADALDGVTPGQKMSLPERTGKVCMNFCRKMREKGAYVMLNHPHWSLLTSPEIEDENPYHAVEIINYASEWLENMGDATVFWTEMLYRGCRLWGGGGDDNHNHHAAAGSDQTDSLYCDSFGGFTVVKARDRSPQAIMEAMFSGSFYTSTGPAIYEFYVEDGTVHVVTSPAIRIYINGERRQYQRKLGRHVTEFVTPLKGTEKLIRAECMDAAGHSAWSNPIFLS